MITITDIPTTEFTADDFEIGEDGKLRSFFRASTVADSPFMAALLWVAKDARRFKNDPHGHTHSEFSAYLINSATVFHEWVKLYCLPAAERLYPGVPLSIQITGVCHD